MARRQAEGVRPTGGMVMLRTIPEPAPRDSETRPGALVAEVLAVGPGLRLRSGLRAPPMVHIGDRVLISDASASADGLADSCLLLPELAILGILGSRAAIRLA